MNRYPVADGGAHGRKASFSGSDGCLAPNAQSEATARALSGPGTSQGGPSPIPSRDRSGAFEVDESVRCYSGNPRDNGCGMDR